MCNFDITILLLQIQSADELYFNSFLSGIGKNKCVNFSSDFSLLPELLIDHRIQWVDSQNTKGPRIVSDGTPFIHLGSRSYECHQGPNRHKKKQDVCYSTALLVVKLSVLSSTSEGRF